MKVKVLKRCLVLTLSLIAFATFGYSQKTKEKPNFSGTWNLDESSIEDLYQSGSLAGTPSIFFMLKIPNCKQKVLIIEHVDPEMKVSRVCRDEPTTKNIPITSGRTYFTDGRGETNTEVGSSNEESVTKWDGNKMVTTVFKPNTNGKRKPAEIRTLSISRHKNQVVETVTLSIENGSYTRYVYKGLK